jgi:hypothetical protein
MKKLVNLKAFKRRKTAGSSENKKVRNATKVEIDGIKFRSKLEAYTYQKLKEAGIEAGYETVKFTLIEPFKYNKESVRAMTYTPDFVGEDFIIECKGFGNDAFPLRWKIFKYYLYTNKLNFRLYMPRNQKQVNEMIEDLLKYKQGYEREELLQTEGAGIQ